MKTNATFKQVLLGSAVLGTLGMLNACTFAPLDIRPIAGVLDQAPTHNRPVTRPVRTSTSFSESLACMDSMLRDYKIPTTLITSKSIPDPTARASVATKEMIITAISQMSRVSNSFRYVDYEVDIVRQDTVQNLTGLLLNANQIQLQRPAIYVSGAVAYVDQGVIRNGTQAGTSATRLETGLSSDWNATLIALEMHLGDFKTRTLIPGIDSSNEVVFGSRGQGLDVSAKIGNYGLNFNLTRTTAMGSGAAVRTLVELGIIELVGKWARVPYWQCLMIESSHPAMERQFRDWFESSKPGAEDQTVDWRIEQAQKGLTALGYYTGAIDSKLDMATRSALARFQTDQQINPSGSLTFETYQRLFKDYVVIDDKGVFQHLAWDKVTEAMAKPKPLTINLAIANLKPMNADFDVGERIFLQVSTSRNAHAACFYKDNKNRISRVFPNPFQRGGALTGNVILRIPDWLSPNQGFALEATDGGQEQVQCFASDTDFFEELPSELKATAILPLAGVPNLELLNTEVGKLATKHKVSSSTVEWTIRPKPIAVGETK